MSSRYGRIHGCVFSWNICYTALNTAKACIHVVRYRVCTLIPDFAKQRHEFKSVPCCQVAMLSTQLLCLQAVQTIHEARIVHSDLKPANFLMVEGQLKLIDFGIAKAISSDTTSIARESQVCLHASVHALGRLQ